MRLLFAACFCLAIMAQSATAERRCGWYASPTPGNLLLTDRDGEWWIQMQGRPDLQGIDNRPPLTGDNSSKPMCLVRATATDVRA